MTKRTGRVALVTGASRGIGRGIAIALAEAGYAVAVNYRREEASAREVVEAIRSLGQPGLAIQADVSKPSQVKRMVQELQAGLGEPLILVNNAGICTPSPLLALDEELWEQTLKVNLSGVFLCTRAIAPIMQAASYGRIINITSIAGIGGGTVGPHYAATKAGVIGFTKSVAQELAPYGITVNAIAPGPIETDMIAAQDPARVENMLRLTPMRRLGRVREVAAVAAFLASDAASYINGETIVVDGGRTRH